jgi:hypothetical protein
MNRSWKFIDGIWTTTWEEWVDHCKKTRMLPPCPMCKNPWLELTISDADHIMKCHACMGEIKTLKEK